MHGVKRTRVDPHIEQTRRSEEVGTRKVYTGLVDSCWLRRSERGTTAEDVDLITKVLDMNPEFYTMWNYRREIMLQDLKHKSAEENFASIERDLLLTTTYLKMHPKVYWIWTHRKWCLEHIPSGPGETDGWKERSWHQELALVDKMLGRDSRNFHAWDYRRYILAVGFPTKDLQSEIRYTTKKIEGNFSNFSAWHQRTKVFARLWDDLDRAAGPEARIKIDRMQEAEFDLVHQALWTDPADQSGWLYHRWLLGNSTNPDLLAREISLIQDLLQAEPDAKWALDSLVYYSILDLKKSHNPEQRIKLVEQIESWLDRLKQVDPYRRKRYDELARDISQE